MPQAAAALAVSDQELARLEGWSRSSRVPAGLAQRARIVALAARGTPMRPSPRGTVEAMIGPEALSMVV